MTEKLPLGIYEHYKSTAEKPVRYRVIGVARHSETDEYLVMYAPLYESSDELWARPLRMFLESVERDGKRVPRFAYVGEMNPEELDARRLLIE